MLLLVLDESAEHEVDKYLKKKNEPLAINPLEYWKHENMFPGIKRLVKSFLSIPASSVASERLFSCAGIVSEKKRCSLKPHKVNQLVFLNKNLKAVDYNY